jgi:hypothetical protein
MRTCADMLTKAPIMSTADSLKGVKTLVHMSAARVLLHATRNVQYSFGTCPPKTRSKMNGVGTRKTVITLDGTTNTRTWRDIFNTTSIKNMMIRLFHAACACFGGERSGTCTTTETELKRMNCKCIHVRSQLDFGCKGKQQNLISKAMFIQWVNH